MKFGTRSGALVALVTMAFSVSERAFATECVHNAAASVHVSQAAAPVQHGHGAPADYSPDSGHSRSDCRHDAAAGCAMSAQLIPARTAIMISAPEVIVMSPFVAPAIDLTTAHSAFHPPRS